MKSNKKQIATTRNPNIAACVKSLFRYETLEQAKSMMKRIHQAFVVSKASTEELIKIWVKGKGLLSTDEIKQGYLGHYYLFEISEIDGRYTISSTKENVQLNKHPEYMRQKQAHPDWGNPLLREIKKGRIYSTIAQANAVLERLHFDYPLVSIPEIGKLYLMVYRKEKGGVEAPLQKYVFTVNVAKDGGYQINFVLNKKAKSARKAVPKTVPDKPQVSFPQPKEQLGYFTSMITLKRARKRK